jgi:MFS family permease
VTHRRLRQARLGVSIIFLIHGLIVAAWVSRISAIQTALHLTPAKLGTALMAIALGSLASMPLTGWLTGRYGSKRIVEVSTIAFCISLPLPGVAFNLLSLAAALACFGAAAGSMDVSMNAHAVTVERHYGRPIMSGFHALFSLGGMAGAAVGGLLAAHGIRPAVHLAWAAAVLAACSIVVFPAMLSRVADQTEATTIALKVSRPLAALGALAFCILVGEGAMADWTSVYLRSSLHTGEGLAAGGYAVFSAAMVIGRLAGDRLTARFGRVALVRWGALIASAGLCAALAIGSVASTLAGFACVGAGFSVIIPLVFGAAGRVKGVSSGAGIATVTTTGYLGFLSGPAIIGYAAELSTLRAALGIVVLLSFVGSLLGGFVAIGEKEAQVDAAEAATAAS